MKSKFFTCGGIALLLVVLLVVGVISGLNMLKDSLEKGLLQDLGFNSKSEYNDFKDAMLYDYENLDVTQYLAKTYNVDDITFVKNSLNEGITLLDGSQLIFDNSYLNINAMDIDNNMQINTPMPFTPAQFAYFETLLYTSLFNNEDSVRNELSELIILSYTLHSQTSHEIVFKLDTTELKKKLEQFSGALPTHLYITLKYDIILAIDSTYDFVNPTIQFNTLNDKYNDKCIRFFEGIWGYDPAKTFANLSLVLINSFDLSSHSRTLFSDTTITLGGSIQ